MIYFINTDSNTFPDPLVLPVDTADKYGLYVIGGNLEPQSILNAYMYGIFPWTDKEGEHFFWYCPQMRFVIKPACVHISHSMRTLLNKGTFHVTFDQDFEGVINGCSAGRIMHEGAWLDHRMISAYTLMHQLGYAHSVEVWHDDRLVGGLYGIKIGGVFFGESMFSTEPSASKVALVSLCRRMVADGDKLIDCQFHTDHLESMGGEYMPYTEFRAIIDG